jgi:hypothetical protein
MTTTTTRYTDLTITGTPAEVDQLLRIARASGRLIAATSARPISPTDPRHRRTVRLAPTTGTTPIRRHVPTRHPAPARRPTPAPRRPNRPIPTTPPQRPRRSRLRIAIITTAVLGVTTLVVGLVYALIALVTAAVTAITAAVPYLLGGLVIAALISIAVASTGGGRHCPGCPD